MIFYQYLLFEINMKNCSNILYFLTIVLITFSGIACAQPDHDEVLEPLESDPTLQPYVRVLANPERFEGKIVSVTGYYMKDTHVNNLFIDKDACLSFDTVNSMAVDGHLNEKDFQGCIRTTVKGEVKYTPGSRGAREHSDIMLVDASFPDF